jgi:ubiquinol-cytochrome c reductase cytochrome b subunit
MTLSDAMKAAAAVAGLVLVLAATSWASEDEARAGELIDSLGCKGCHSLNGGGGTLGPALDAVGKRLDGNRIRRKLLDPKATKPDSMMPSYARLPEKDIDTLVDYLKNLK